MSNLLNASLPSEDEEDQDYVPDEVDEDERKAAKQAKQPKRMRGMAVGTALQDPKADNSSGAGGDEIDSDDDALPDSKREAKKAKVDALWSQLSRAGAQKPAVAKPGTSLASLCRPAGGTGKGGGDEVSEAGC
jgi:hypothetical protein